MLNMKRTYMIITLAATLTLSSRAAKVETISVYSESMKKEVPISVILPYCYSTDKQYPVVYLLHGAGGDHTPKTSGHCRAFTTYALPVLFKFIDNRFKTGTAQLETGCRAHIGAAQRIQCGLK